MTSICPPWRRTHRYADRPEPPAVSRGRAHPPGVARGRTRVGLGLLALVLVFCARAAVAGLAEVTLTVERIDNHGCFDRVLGIFCQKPDYALRAGLRGPDGTIVWCGPPDLLTEPTANLDTVVGPIPACTGERVEEPFSLVVALYDIDESRIGTGQRLLVQEQADLDPGTARDVRIPWYALGSGVVSISGPDADVLLTVARKRALPTFGEPLAVQYAQPAEGPPDAVSSFDPSIGEQVLLYGSVSHPINTRVRFSVRPAAGGPAWEIAEAPFSSQFRITWDGRIAGQLVAPGDYIAEATLLESGETRSATVKVAAITRPFDLLEPRPSPTWNPRAGALDLPYRLGADATVEGLVLGPLPGSGTCRAPGVPIATRFPARVLPRGSGALAWEPRDATGNFLKDGWYCIALTASRPSVGVFGAGTAEVFLSTAPMRLFASVVPAVPALLPGRPVTVEARVTDPLRAPRYTQAIRVRAYPFVPGPVDPTSVAQATCRSANTCRLVVPSAVAAAAAAGLVFEAEARDADDASAGEAASTPPRLVDLVARDPRVVRVSVPLEGSPAEGLVESARTRVLDTVFHPGSGYQGIADGPPPWPAFMGEVAAAMAVLLGEEPSVADTSIAANLQHAGFWAALTPAEITVGEGGICQRAAMTSVPFAEVQAVLHQVPCRDNADSTGTTLSAFGAMTLWHEYHHSAFGLSDEYAGARSPRRTDPYPNVLASEADCRSFGAEPTLCTSFSDASGGLWWRAAPEPDVMIRSGPENPDDVRRASWLFDECRRSRC